MEHLQTQLQDETALIGALVDGADSPAPIEPEPATAPVVEVGQAQIVEAEGPSVPIDAAKEWAMQRQLQRQQAIVGWTILLRQANLYSLSVQADWRAAHQHGQEADMAGPWMPAPEEPHTKTRSASGAVRMVPRVYKVQVARKPHNLPPHILQDILRKQAEMIREQHKP